MGLRQAGVGKGEEKGVLRTEPPGAGHSAGRAPAWSSPGREGAEGRAARGQSLGGADPMGICSCTSKHQVCVGVGPDLSLDGASVVHQTNERSRTWAIPVATLRGGGALGERNAVSSASSQGSRESAQPEASGALVAGAARRSDRWGCPDKATRCVPLGSAE